MKNQLFLIQRTSTILAVSVLSLTLVSAVTGALLAFNYEPTAGGAYNSLAQITENIPFGWLIRRVHNLAGNLVIGVALIQLVVMFLGERFHRSWLTAWISGIFLLLAAIGLGWTAMILDWSQVGFWRLKVELGIIESIPLAGNYLREILTGGDGISTLTVQHMYTLHSYVLSLGAVGLALLHLGSLVWQERSIATSELCSEESSTDTDARSLA